MPPHFPLGCPLLFLLFINDIVSYLVTKSLMFVDDLKIYMEINSVENLQDNNNTLVNNAVVKTLFSLDVEKYCTVTYKKKQLTSSIISVVAFCALL